MTTYTPTTDVIRQACTFERNRLGEPRTITVEAFERWLAGVNAEAWDHGHETGIIDAWNGDSDHTPNPYRIEEEA